ncbi:MAG TPA: hypothetical protein ENJ18_06720 [Nannocystis exedens]|nr:hypothetical protein [Nannocystis exedens]
MVTEELESDWIHSVFEVFREEVVAIAADFGDRVKHEIDQIAASEGVRPPSTISLLTAVAIESSNVTVSMLSLNKKSSSGEGEGNVERKEDVSGVESGVSPRTGDSPEENKD